MDAHIRAHAAAAQRVYDFLKSHAARFKGKTERAVVPLRRAQHAPAQVRSSLDAFHEGGLHANIENTESMLRLLSGQKIEVSARTNLPIKEGVAFADNGTIVLVCSSWHSREGDEVLSVCRYVKRVGCLRHQSPTDNPCWRMLPTHQCVYARNFAPVDEYVRMVPKMKNVREMKLTAVRSCYTALEQPQISLALSPDSVTTASQVLTEYANVDLPKDSELLRGIARAFPLTVLHWSSDGALLSLESLPCPGCQETHLSVATYLYPSLCGVSRHGLIRVAIPTFSCGGCGCAVASPFDARLVCQVPAPWKLSWDSYGRRHIDHHSSDWLCGGLRRLFNQNALLTSLAKKLWPEQCVQISGVADQRVRAWVVAVFLHALPLPAWLGNLVISYFQRDERPGIEPLAVVVCCGFGITVAVDASATPMKEVRFKRPSRMPGVAEGSPPPQPIKKCIKGLGLFNVPLLPNIYIAEENSMETMLIFAWVLVCLGRWNAMACPLGLADDCLEHTFSSTMQYLAKVCLPQLQARRISIDFGRHRVENFYRAQDVIHVMWRLQDCLNRSSMDLELAVACLKILFQMFNPSRAEWYAAFRQVEEAMLFRAWVCMYSLVWSPELVITLLPRSFLSASAWPLLCNYVPGVQPWPDHAERSGDSPPHTQPLES